MTTNRVVISASIAQPAQPLYRLPVLMLDIGP